MTYTFYGIEEPQRTENKKNKSNDKRKNKKQSGQKSKKEERIETKLTKMLDMTTRIFDIAPSVKSQVKYRSKIFLAQLTAIVAYKTNKLTSMVETVR